MMKNNTFELLNSFYVSSILMQLQLTEMNEYENTDMANIGNINYIKVLICLLYLHYAVKLILDI